MAICGYLMLFREVINNFGITKSLRMQLANRIDDDCVAQAFTLLGQFQFVSQCVNAARRSINLASAPATTLGLIVLLDQLLV